MPARRAVPYSLRPEQTSVRHPGVTERQPRFYREASVRPKGATERSSKSAPGGRYGVLKLKPQMPGSR